MLPNFYGLKKNKMDSEVEIVQLGAVIHCQYVDGKVRIDGPMSKTESRVKLRQLEGDAAVALCVLQVSTQIPFQDIVKHMVETMTAKSEQLQDQFRKLELESN